MDTNTSTSYCVRKDMTGMSFVGLHNTKEGIIAFADSKASRIDNNMQIYEDVERGHIQKIFKNKQFICVTHGNNELFSGFKKQNLEDYFKNRLNKDQSYKDFFQLLVWELQQYPPEYHNGQYNFIIGSHDEKGYYIRQLTIQINNPNETMKYTEKYYKYNVIYGGKEEYIKMYDIVPKYYNIPIKTYSDTIKKQVTKLVEIFDLDCKYNSVGKPINVEIFQ